MEEFSFLTFNAKQTFTQLKQVFTKAIILQYFDSGHHIQIKTNTSDYTIGYIIS